MTSNPYYEPGKNRARKVHLLFSSIAGRYDLINDLQSLGLHRLWKRKLVRLARVRPGDRALDLCCGTGDLAEAFHRAHARVTALDFNRDMLQIARKRSLKRHGNSIDYLRGDALELPCRDGQFDAVSMGYGLRNLADLDQGLEEMVRVAKLGGRVLILDFGKPENVFLKGLYSGYLKCAVPVFGKAFCGDGAAYRYILESLNHYPGPEAVDQRLKLLGCAETRVRRIFGGAMSINVGVKA